MQKIRSVLLTEHSLVFLFCLAVLTGPSISTLFTYDLSQFPDCDTYLGLANFDFDQSPVRRFRVIVPFAASIINFLFGNVFEKLAPTYFQGNFSLPFSFFIVNILLTSYFGLLIYRYCKAFGLEQWIALVATLAMLTSRYAIYISALPLIDSLFCVTVAMTLLGIKEKNTGMLVAAMFIGPFAKEAYIFIAPLIFFFSHMSKSRSAVLLALSGLLVFTYRYIYELYTPPTELSGLTADLYHIYLLPKFMQVLFSFYGLYKVFTNLFFWIMFPVIALVLIPGFRAKLWQKRDKVVIWFMVSVLFQLLLTVSVERIFFIAMPVVCLFIGLSINELKKYI